MTWHRWAATAFLVGTGGVVAIAGTAAETHAGAARTHPQAGAPATAPSAHRWIGKKAAPFRLSDSDGRTVDSASYFGKQPVVLVFYRGIW